MGDEGRGIRDEGGGMRDEGRGMGDGGWDAQRVAAASRRATLRGPAGRHSREGGNPEPADLGPGNGAWHVPCGPLLQDKARAAPKEQA